jgi:mRNA interferase RelE/StbE
MAWRIELDPAAERELSKLDPQVARRILRFLQERVANLEDPRSIGEALRGSRLGEFWKYRIGDYRIISSIEDGALRILGGADRQPPRGLPLDREPSA